MSSTQVRHGITFGSGERGQEIEAHLRLAAKKELGDLDGKEFPVWIKQTLMARANALLGAQEGQEK